MTEYTFFAKLRSWMAMGFLSLGMVLPLGYLGWALTGQPTIGGAGGGLPVMLGFSAMVIGILCILWGLMFGKED